MKVFLSIVVNCIMITLLVQCKSVKPTTERMISGEDNEEMGTKYEDVVLRQDTLFLYCNDFSGYFDNKRKSIIAYNNGMIDYCLREKAFQGDTASVRQVAELILLMRNPFGTFNQKLRGEKIFKAVLDRLHNFEFVPVPSGEMDVITYYGSYARIMSEMIESIDGMSQYDYLNKYIYTKGRAELESEELFSPKYDQILARLSWETYKEAYDKGLIKFKAFGQE